VKVKQVTQVIPQQVEGSSCGEMINVTHRDWWNLGKKKAQRDFTDRNKEKYFLFSLERTLT